MFTGMEGPMNVDNPSILVFDSGVGGLSVYTELQSILPKRHYIYVFDNEVFPYGEKPENLIIRRVTAILDRITREYPIALVVIACNTASTVTLPTLRSRFSFPIVGVVPAIKPAVALTRNGVIGLLATRATIKRSYTKTLLTRFASHYRVEMLGSAALVELAEAKLRCHFSVMDEKLLGKITAILEPWLLMPEPPDTVVLGCTHFPLLKEELLAVLPAGTELVDSGAAVARHTVCLLKKNDHSTHLSPAFTHPLTARENLAFCLTRNQDVNILLPTLARYGFPTLNTLVL